MVVCDPDIGDAAAIAALVSRELEAAKQQYRDDLKLDAATPLRSRMVVTISPPGYAVNVWRKNEQGSLAGPILTVLYDGDIKRLEHHYNWADPNG